MLETSWLRAFAAFAEHKNFTHAARALGLSQPALHAQVQKLAEVVGAPLYRRVGRALVLTDGGERVAAYARRTLAQQAEFVEGLRAGRPRTRVVLSAGEGAYLYLIGEAVQRSVRDARTPLSLLVRDAAGTLAAVRTGEAHVGVLPLETRLPRLVVEPLATVGQMLVVPEGHALAGKERVEFADLEGAALVVPPEGQPQRVVLEESLRAAGVRWDVAVEVRGWPLTLRLARLGAGLAIVNDFCRLPPGLVGRPIAGLPNQTYAAIRLADAPLEGGTERVWRRLLAAARR
ncbi:LysR family transcriptional regulator [Polyangium sp. y55x31]|uniref:LysR family transcriptional regulator n=1 Tax=Polyangium sp. y55x31 TaxID=3042688 RepID=UPI002482BF22|nr:LysR family transcriptional regulator [Polyangium sp. y55x31]MDI1483828.1 LysR family transcriptional regulator [Polyangium sp. y55x31]